MRNLSARVLLKNRIVWNVTMDVAAFMDTVSALYLDA